MAEIETCEYCYGAGGWDASIDCENYDDWQDCIWCQGTGEALYTEDNLFIPERDAWMPGD